MNNHRRVHVVTDSASDIPRHIQEELSIAVVPLSITIGTETFLDGVDITSKEYIDRLREANKLPTTAQPSVDQFIQEYQKGLDADMDVLCITLSSGLSGTFNSASLAAEQTNPERVRVIDSHSATMQLGWIVIEAARAAQGGASLEEAATIAQQTIPKSFCFAVLRTLDYAYKGGRIGRATHMVGSALGIKPIVGFDGVLVAYERVRTWKKAVARAIELASSKGEPLDIAVLHSDNLEDAQMIEREMISRFPHANILVDWTGSIVSTYAGPDGAGIMVRVG